MAEINNNNGNGRESKPRIDRLKSAIDETTIHIYERTKEPFKQGDEWVYKTVRGAYDPSTDRIKIGKVLHRKWAGADDMIMSLIHESIHVARPTWPERLVRQMEAHFFKSLALREHAAVRLLNVTLFGNGWEEWIPRHEHKKKEAPVNPEPTIMITPEPSPDSSLLPPHPTEEQLGPPGGSAFVVQSSEALPQEH